MFVVNVVEYLSGLCRGFFRACKARRIDVTPAGARARSLPWAAAWRRPWTPGRGWFRRARPPQWFALDVEVVVISAIVGAAFAPGPSHPRVSKRCIFLPQLSHRTRHTSTALLALRQTPAIRHPSRTQTFSQNLQPDLDALPGCFFTYRLTFCVGDDDEPRRSQFDYVVDAGARAPNPRPSNPSPASRGC